MRTRGNEIINEINQKKMNENNITKKKPSKTPLTEKNPL